MDDTGLSPHARIIPLRGFSGCRVVLVDKGGDVFVRKMARDNAYNNRLLLQAEKQKNFACDSAFQPVKIRDVGQLNSGIVYIDMDYVPGITAAETLETLPLAEIQNWSSLLLRFAPNPATKHEALSPTLFHEKIKSLEQDLIARSYATPLVSGSLEILQSRTWNNIPHSPCHGDLTLENIIVHDGKLQLIDFLDSFADSWYMDIAKLLQDILGGWSFRHKPTDRNLILRLAGLRHTLEASLETLYPGCMSPIRDLYALGLLRILPYASSPDDRAFVEGRLSAALNDFLQ